MDSLATLAVQVPANPYTSPMAVLKRLSVTLLILLLIYVGIVQFTWKSWLFQPKPYPAGDWGAQQVYSAQNIWLPTPSGKINGWFVPSAEPAQRTVLFFHSRRGNIASNVEQILRWRDTSSDLFLIDYSGYGRSSGTPSVAALYQDADAAYQYLRKARNLPANKIVLAGDEIGCALAAHLAAQHPHTAALVLLYPVPDLRSLLDSSLPLAGFFRPNAFEIGPALRHYSGPKLFLYGTGSGEISSDLPQRVYDAAPTPKQRQVLDGARQSVFAVEAGYRYTDWLNDFFTKTPAAAPAQKDKPLPMMPISH